MMDSAPTGSTASMSVILCDLHTAVSARMEVYERWNHLERELYSRKGNLDPLGVHDGVEVEVNDAETPLARSLSYDTVSA